MSDTRAVQPSHGHARLMPAPGPRLTCGPQPTPALGTWPGVCAPPASEGLDAPAPLVLSCDHRSVATPRLPRLAS